MASLVVPIFLTVDRLPRQRLITFGHTELASLAMRAMREHHVRHVPVTGADGRLLGVVSYRDLIEADVPRRAVTLDEVRSVGAFTATPGETLVDCIRRMHEHHVGCLPVVEGDAVVRMVTRRDLLNAAATGIEEEGLFEDDVPTVWSEAR